MKACIKCIVKPLAILVVAAFFGCLINPTKVQAADAVGGDSLGTAVQITPGQYNGPALEFEQAAYYKITVNAGQELKVVGSFIPMTTSYGGTSNSIRFYDENYVQLVDQYENSSVAVNVVTATTLASSVKSSQTYYIEITDESWGTASSTLDISLTDRFDANSTTDAGQTIDTALPIALGEYNGYLSQVDTDDYYSVSAAAGQLSVSITPYVDMSPTIEIYDQDRTLLASQWAQNAGEIFQVTANIQKAGNVYVHINCDMNTGCVDEAYEYAFTVAAANSENLISTGNGGTTSSTSTTTQPVTESKSTNYLWWIIAAVVVAVIVVLIIIFASRRKKSQPTTATSSAASTTTPPVAPSTDRPVTPAPTPPASSEPESKQSDKQPRA